MISQLAHLNWISVLIAFVIYFVLGALWFTLFFSKSYKRSLGRDATEVLPNKPIFIAGPALCCLVITIATALLMYALPVSSPGEVVEFGLLIGLGFLVANTVNIAINPNIPHPLFYSVISGTYHLAGILIVCSILAVMK